MDRRDNDVWGKYISYSSVNFGFSVLGIAVTTLLMYYYTDVLMLPALAVSGILFTARLFDGVVDPFIGHYMDGRATRLGKYRGYVVYWAAPACAAFALMFAPSPFAGAAKIAWCLLLYLLFTLAFSFVEVASLPMLASFGSRERRSAGNTLKITACIVATLTVTMFSMKLVQILGGGSEEAGFSRMAMLFAIAVFVSLMLGGLGFKEGAYAAADGEGEKIGARRAIAIVMREKSIVFMLCMYLLIDAASAFKMQGGIYYLKYNIGRPDLISVFLTSSILASLLAQPLVFHFSRRFGLRELMVWGCAVSAVSMITIGLSGSSVVPLIVGNCMYGAASAFPVNLVFSRMVELSEQLGKKQGKPFGGVVNSFIGLASRVGCSLSSAILSLILYVTAYTPNETQGGAALLGITTGFILLPIVSLAAGGICASLSFRGLESESGVLRSVDLVSGESET